jgi:hypothetical protein
MKGILTLSALLFALLLTHISNATVRKVYFVGNSYTYTNSMPDMLRDFTTAQGDTIIYAMSAPGGYTLQQHTTNATTIAGIFSQQWDVVVLQEQSQLPSFTPAEVATEVYPYATRLDSFINANDTCTQTMFMMTWGRRNGDVMNCPVYPVVCTYEGMQDRLRTSYMQMALDNGAVVAPMGAAWHIVIDSFPAIDLYQTDSSHPSVSGSYLQACVFYASIFHRPSLGCTYLGGLSLSTAQTLQRIADKVVLDSLEQWQENGHYPYASFSFAHTGGNSVSFSNHSQRAATYNWNFGDGVSVSTASPSHTYAAPGIYTVSLTVLNDCFTFTRSDTVHIGVVTGVINQSATSATVSILQGGAGTTTFVLPEQGHYDVLEVYDATGRSIRKYTQCADNIADHFAPGFYVFRAYSSDRRETYTGKFKVY